MKSYVIAFGISLVAACLFNEIPVAKPPAIPVGISGVELRTIPVMHEDGYIGEVNMSNTTRPGGVATQIRDGLGGRDGISFPANANN